MADRLDFRKLRYVVAVAQVHSLTAAARLLSITQPALTRCISEVEEDLGIQIFMRLPRGVELTEEGEKFVNRARVLVADLEALGQDFHSGKGASRQRLRIGGAPGTYLTLAAPSLAKFAQGNPDVDISTSTGLPREIIPRLETGELDVVLTTTYHMEHWPDLPMENLAPLQMAFMVKKGHPLENRKQINREDLQEFPAILGATSDALQVNMAEVFGKQGLPPLNATYVTDDFTLIFSLLNQTNAYFPIISISTSMQELSQQFSMISMGTPSKKHQLCLAYSKTRSVSPLAKTFAAIMKEMLDT
ncbi:LysR family transcriptional regulator [Pseudomaricurvus alkylphenolicus]|jgi:LysR family transcriptional regulator of abg operon|uniref:LysR family transcriptional regulator n=1 Tax=Pseudomaricurvus alkylphenolicus TaxID=1306991 RepID=UPI0014201811|nr:LysR family transcriptional regulator [Pseudomaricurvus alkylphenolicus]NIB38129.1 LysR family transcriptional regulator [Pseudomaricurvus alkylphenolicus]